MPEDTQTPPPLTPAPAHAFSRTTIIIAAGIFAFFVILAVAGVLYFQVSDVSKGQDSTLVAAGPILDSLGQPTGYERDSQNVYFIDKGTEGKSIVAGADPKTFSVIYGNFGPAEAPADANSANWLFHTLGKDARAVYSDSMAVAGSDAPTFLSMTGAENFYKDKNAIYYFNPKKGLSALPDADPNTLKIRTDLPDDQGQIYFSSDKSHVYLLSSVIEGADPNAFEIIKNGEGKPTQYEKDKSSIYFLDKKVSGADYSTFSIPNPYPTGNNFYNAQDKNHKYLNGQVLGTTAAQTSKIPEGADAASFQTVNDQAGKFNQLFGKDKNNVYEWSDAGIWGVLPNADPATFSFDSSTDIAKDSLHVWANIDRLVPNADSATFSKINRFWYKDRNHVFSSAYDPGGHLDIIVSANPLTFTPLLLKGEATVYGTNTTHDKIFCGGESDVMDADAASFEILSIFSSKDKNHTYDGCSIYDPKNP